MTSKNSNTISISSRVVPKVDANEQSVSEEEELKPAVMMSSQLQPLAIPVSFSLQSAQIPAEFHHQWLNTYITRQNQQQLPAAQYNSLDDLLNSLLAINSTTPTIQSLPTLPSLSPSPPPASPMYNFSSNHQVIASLLQSQLAFMQNNYYAFGPGQQYSNSINLNVTKLTNF